jgi:hypothetical protein
VQAGAAAAAWVTVKVLPAIVRVPVRAAPVLAAMVYATVPLPLPDVPEVIAIQAALDAAVHAQPPPVESATTPFLPSAGATSPGAAKANVQGAGPGGGGSGVGGGGGVGVGEGGGTASWRMVTTSEPTITVPVRSGPALAAIVSVIDAERVPDPLAVIVIHGAWLIAFHEQPVSVSTAIATLPPVDGTVALAGLTPNLQGAASWMTRISVLLTSSAPRRWTGSAFVFTR